MKAIRTLSHALTAVYLLTTASAALATQVGPYIGFGAGKGIVEIPNKAVFTGSTTRSYSGTAYRAFGGLNINKYFGMEFGYTRYARALYVGRLAGNYSSIAYYARTYDAVAKAYLPLSDSGFNAYVLAGIARVVMTTNFTNNGIPLTGAIMTPTNGTSHAYHNRPIYGFGLNYNFTRRWTANVEITRIQHLNSLSNSTSAIPTIDLATVNIAYNFC